MNSFSGIVQFGATDLRYTEDNPTPFATQTLTLKNQGKDGGFQIESIAWGKMVAAVTDLDEGTIALVSGQMSMIKVQKEGYVDTVATLKIEKIRAILPTLVEDNLISLIGNVGGEVDSRYFDSGKNNAKFSLAVRRNKTDTDWFSIECWGDTAKLAAKYVEKGTSLGIVGYVKMETWTDRNTGKERSKLVVVADRITLGKKLSGGQQSSNPGYAKDF